MNSSTRHTYVLIAGAWHGGWVWRDVIPELRRLGHSVTALTLTGTGERHHNGSNDTGLATHIEDVIAHIKMEGLDNVTLVGWSYGGMVIAGVASQISEKIKSLIYVDAFVPENGKSALDYFGSDARAMVEALAAESKPIPPLPLAVFGVTDPALIEFVTPRLTTQPWRSFVEKVELTSLPDRIGMAYVYCSGYQALFTGFYEQFKNDPNVKTAVLDTGHLCMLSEPLATAQLLVEFA